LFDTYNYRQDRKWSTQYIRKVERLELLGGSVGWTAAFGPGHGPGVLGSSPESGPLPSGELASPSPCSA